LAYNDPMTTVGHSLTGLSIGLLCMPARWRRLAKTALLVAFVLLANVPDYRYVREYGYRHSLLVNVPMILAAALLLALRPGWRRRIGGWPVVGAGAGAWLSHLLLDTFYSDGGGIFLFYPSRAVHLSLSMPWFDTLNYGWEPTARTARILGTEAAVYGTLVLLCMLIRSALQRHRRTRVALHPQDELEGR